jgi:hypothetical protein
MRFIGLAVVLDLDGRVTFRFSSEGGRQEVLHRNGHGWDGAPRLRAQPRVADAMAPATRRSSSRRSNGLCR